MAKADVLIYDVGTSSMKLVVYDRDGNVTASKTIPYEYKTPRAGWAEIDPSLWEAALFAGLEELGRDGQLSEIRAVSGTGQMHTAVLIDDSGKAISPSILWLDRRAEAETAELLEMFGLAPSVLNTTYTLPKLYWMKKHCPEVLERAKHLLLPKDYIRYLLTGILSTDPTEGIGAALTDWETGEWTTDRLDVLGIDPSILVPIRPSDAVVGRVRPDLCQRFGIDPQAAVYSGYGDMVALLGGAPHKPGRMVYSLGSSAMYFTAIPQKNKTTPDNSLYTFDLAGYHLFGGVTSTAGASPVWFYENMWKTGTFPEMAEAAMGARPGVDGLVFIPYLAGERSPYWSDTVAGGFYGVRLQHDLKDFARAVFEGIAYSLRHVLDLCEENDVPITEISMAAGGVRTEGWPQMFADICGRPVTIYAGQDTVTKVVRAMCSASLEGKVFNDVLLESFLEPRLIEPDPALKPVYDSVYKKYRAFSAFANTCDS